MNKFVVVLGWSEDLYKFFYSVENSSIFTCTTHRYLFSNFTQQHLHRIMFKRVYQRLLFGAILGAGSKISHLSG